VLPLTRNKLPIIIGLAAILAIAGIFAFAPVEQASTVHDTIGKGGSTVTITKTLDSDGTDVTFTFVSENNALIDEILIDNTPTFSDGALCTLKTVFNSNPSNDGKIKCKDSRFRVQDFTNGESQILPGNYKDNCHTAAKNILSARMMLEIGFGSCPGGDITNVIPVKAGDELVLTLDASGNANDVKVKVTFAFSGGNDATLE